MNCNRLQGGDFINIYDISKQAGVSIATVSRVINDSGNVSEKTRERVLDVINQTGYTPNIFARGLGLNSMSTIGIMCSNSSDIFLASAIYLVEQGLRKHNYDCLLCCTGYDIEDKKKYLNLLLSKRVDAIILMGSDFITNENNDYIVEVAGKVPIILLNSYMDAHNIYSVLCDDAQIVYDVTTKLLNDNIKNILFLNRRNTFGGTQKSNGFLKAHKDLNITISEAQIKTFDGNVEEVKQLLLKSKNLNFEAVITSDDELAIGVIKYAKSQKLKIPEDLSVIGYNNSNIATYCSPELSTIDNKLEHCCFNVITIVTSLLKGENVPNKTIISADFIKRETTK